MISPKLKVITLVILLFLISLNYVSIKIESQDSSKGQNEEYQLTEFSTGGEKLRLTASPEGEVVYLKLPSNATVLNTTLELKGILPPQLISYQVGLSPEFITGADFNNDNNIDILLGARSKK